MKNKTKKTLAWLLILASAFYIGYHAIINGAFTGLVTHTYVFIAVIIWLIGDWLLSEVKR